MSKSSEGAPVTRTAVFLATALIGASAGAQKITADDLGAVPITVYIPATNTSLNAGQAEQLGSRLAQLVAASGLSGVGPDAGFALTPQVTVTRRGQAGELRAMQIVKMDLAMIIRQRTQNLTFASASTTLTGSGDSEVAAITDAIASMSTDDERLKAFVEQGKRRIVAYYESNCAAIRADAKGKAGSGNVDEAVALLLSVPREAATCQPKAAQDAEALFTSFQARQCAQLVRGARADAANRAFDDAVEKLQSVDPSSPCAADADALIARIETQVARTEDRSFQLRLRALRVDRETLTKTLNGPTRIVERRRELTRGVAVEFINKLPARPHVPS